MSGLVKTNLYSTLFRWAHRQDENFVTEGFTYILSRLLEREPIVARDLIHRLCSRASDAAFDLGKQISITTQFTTDEGRPDLCIQSDSFLALVEFKKGSGLGPDQLERYSRWLKKNANGRMTRLVLLSVFLVAPEENDGQTKARDETPLDVVYRRWHSVADWLKHSAELSETSQFLIDEFLDFLGEQIMTVEQVSWQYLEGTRALCRFTDMLGKALENAGIQIHQRSSGWDSRGLYTEGKRFWIGVYLSRPSVLQFEFVDAAPDVERFKNLGRGEILDKKCLFTSDLTSEAVHFFSRSKDSQLDFLTTFVTQAHNDARACVL